MTISRLPTPALVLIAVIIGVLLGAILDTAVLHDAQVTIGGDAILAGGTFVMAGLMLAFLWGQSHEIAALRERVAKLEGKQS